jgi:hypothetical protein
MASIQGNITGSAHDWSFIKDCIKMCTIPPPNHTDKARYRLRTLRGPTLTDFFARLMRRITKKSISQRLGVGLAVTESVDFGPGSLQGRYREDTPAPDRPGWLVQAATCAPTHAASSPMTTHRA